MTRLFIAIDPDERVRAEIAKISAALRARAPVGRRISWVPAERLHLTLEFLGDVDEGLAALATRALTQPLSVKPFDATFEGIGVFPSPGQARVLWLGVSTGVDPMRECRRQVLARLAGRHIGEEPFTPHLTLARFRDRVPRGEVRSLTSLSADAGSCLIDRVTLYESRRSPAGQVYVPITGARLQP